METVSSKVHEGTEDEIEDYQNRHDIDTRSEAIRRLIRSGLDEDDQEDGIPLGYVLSAIGAFLVGAAIATIEPAGPMALIGIILWMGGPLIHSSRVRSAVEQARSRGYTLVSDS